MDRAQLAAGQRLGRGGVPDERSRLPSSLVPIEFGLPESGSALGLVD